MTEIDFYKIEGLGAQARDRFACRLVEKIYRVGQAVFVHTEDKVHAASLDDLLWTWRQGSFVPHQLAGADPEADGECPVLIGSEHEPDGFPHQVLVNLASEVPGFVACFERVAEIVTDDEALRAAGRSKYRHYQERGFALRYHDLSQVSE